MNSFWLIPDYSQSGTVVCVLNGAVSPLHKALPLAAIPPELILGIPEELLIQYPDQDFVFTQFCRGRNGESYFACSIRAGVDVSGRTVTLTNLQCLAPGETPATPPPVDAALQGEAESAMRRLVYLLAHPTPQRDKMHAMLEALEALPRFTSFASDTLRKSAHRPQWMPDTAKKKVSKRTLSLIVISIFFLLGVVFLRRTWIS